MSFIVDGIQYDKITDLAERLDSAQDGFVRLKKREQELYARIGKKALESQGDGAFPDDTPELRLIQSTITKVKADIQAMQSSLSQSALRRGPEHDTAEPPIPSQNSATHATAESAAARVSSPTAARQAPADDRILCPSCGMTSPKGVKFCMECGAAVSDNKKCPSCGKLNASKSKFCIECGNRI